VKKEVWEEVLSEAMKLKDLLMIKVALKGKVL
jgi:hypothetical protein